jgi:hypothetical protein
VTKKRQYWRWGKNGDAPDWECPTEADVKKFRRWTIHELESRTDWEEQLEKYWPPDETAEERAMRVADEGDIEPLKKLYPHLARFLFPPVGSTKGDRRPKDPYKGSIWAKAAAADAVMIRAIWLESYGVWKRRKEPTAAGIAAGLYDGVDVRSVKTALKTKRPSKC